ncbi:MAG TPA: TetR/AcrR family transcriptional regulator [Kribbellaceae bacterium]|nr:TetR/AcrR family transcriptional regulator [Kribbellaceae bacterium]
MTSATDPTTPAAARPRRRDRAARELEMLDAAEDIFGERGYAGTSMDDVAARAGVSKPLVYQYYGSKDGLFVACLARLRAQLFESVADVVLTAPDAERAMYEGLAQWFRFLDEHPRAWAVMVDEGMLSAGPAAEAADQVRADFVELIASMVRINLPAERETSEDEIHVVAQALSGATERLAVWRSRHGGGPPPEQVAAMLMNLFWIGLRGVRAGESWA